jgi:uncharacterized protein (DUF1810 family)
MRDDFHLQRFHDAQAPIYDLAVATLRDGAMCTSYMDFIFPRLGDPSFEPFALASLDEARAFLAFPTLGNRYRECVDALSWLEGSTPAELLGDDDARRLQASLTLFAEATNEPQMRTVLAVWYDSRVDEDTMDRIALIS